MCSLPAILVSNEVSFKVFLSAPEDGTSRISKSVSFFYFLLLLQSKAALRCFWIFLKSYFSFTLKNCNPVHQSLTVNMCRSEDELFSLSVILKSVPNLPAGQCLFLMQSRLRICTFSQNILDGHDLD